MNDDLSPRGALPPDDGPIDDELLNAVLDGEATPAERALVEGSAEGRRRLDRLRAAAEAVAEPVEPLDAATVDRLIARAVEVGPAEAALPRTAARPDPAPADELGALRARRTGWRTLGGVAAAVAAVILLVGGITALTRVGGRSSSDTASSSADESAGSTASQEPELATGGADATAPTLLPPDLGPLPDVDAVVTRYDQLLLAAPEATEHQFPTRSSSGAPGGAAADATSAVCSVPPVAVVAGEAWSVTAIAVLPTGPVLVMSNGVAPPASRILVVDTQTCTVLVDRTR